MSEDSVTRRRRALLRGHEAELHVADLLVQVGWRVLARNWTGGGGELDIVAELNGKLRFVEVRARASDETVPVEDTITPAKQGRLRRAARAWLVSDGRVDWAEMAFLVALVDLSVEPWSVDWLDDAFDGV